MEINTNKIDLTTDGQKLFAGFLLLVALAVLYWVLPPLIYIMQNLIIAGILGAVIVVAVSMRTAIWNGLKQLSWNLTKSLISGDKLGWMYRYYDPYLIGKIKDLEKSILSVGGIQVTLFRKAKELQANIKLNSEKAIQYENKNAAETVIRTLRNKVATDTKQLDSLTPKLKNIESQLKSLQELHDLWSADAEDLKYTLDAKAEEYRLLKELDKAAGSANAFLKGNSEEYKIYQESLHQIEESVSIYTANIANFERQARPIIDNLSMERSVSEDAGAKLIAEFKKNSTSLKIEN